MSPAKRDPRGPSGYTTALSKVDRAEAKRFIVFEVNAKENCFWADGFARDGDANRQVLECQGWRLPLEPMSYEFRGKTYSVVNELTAEVKVRFFAAIDPGKHFKFPVKFFKNPVKYFESVLSNHLT